MATTAEEVRPRSLRDYGAVLSAVALCEGAGGLGALFTSEGVRDWYPTLRKPSFNPPSWVFGPVWTLLYALMGISGWLLWRRREERAGRVALQLFGAQLLLNVLWSYLFFARRSPRAAFVEIVLLWAAIALTLRAAWRVGPVAGLLLTPYLAWASFAALLTWKIWRLNP